MSYGFDTNEVELETLGLPAGTYKTMIVGEEFKDSDNPKNPKRLILTFEVLEGDMKGKSHMQGYNIFYVDAVPRNISIQEIKKIAKATGAEVNDQNPLKNRVVKITVGKQKNSDYMEIKSYAPAEDTAF